MHKIRKNYWTVMNCLRYLKTDRWTNQQNNRFGYIGPLWVDPGSKIWTNYIWYWSLTTLNQFRMHSKAFTSMLNAMIKETQCKKKFNMPCLIGFAVWLFKRKIREKLLPMSCNDESSLWFVVIKSSCTLYYYQALILCTIHPFHNKVAS